MYESNIFQPYPRHTFYIAFIGIVFVSVSANPFSGSYCESYSEQFSECVNPCNTCLQRGHCMYERPPCYSGCDCIDGYFRDEQNNCVPQEYCGVVECPPNEFKTHCVSPCNDCHTKGDCNFFRCEPGCDCYQGFYRNITGQCVPEESCSMGCPNPNEVYHQCIPTCRTTCENFNSTEQCAMLDCIPGCACMKDHVRRMEDGMCVPISSCKSACGPNESLQACSDACNTCKRRGTGCREINCMEMSCVCNAGYTKDDYGRCILVSECPPPPPVPLCNDLEEFYECMPSCKNTCDNYFDSNAVCPEECVPGCFCKQGYLKDQLGQCVPYDECIHTDGECKKNEGFQICFDSCERTCADILSGSSSCTIPQPCKYGCFCEFEFYRSADGRCVTSEECGVAPAYGEPKPSAETIVPLVPCGENQHFYECIPKCERTCASLTRNPPKCEKTGCISGCYCLDDFYLTDDGRCVQIEECSDDDPIPQLSEDTKCGINEQLYSCMPECLNTCDALEKNMDTRDCYSDCKPGCFCSPNFYKAKNGSCVKEEHCSLKTILPNKTISHDEFLRGDKRCKNPDEEFWNCMPSCEHSCETLATPRFCDHDICIPGCFCRHSLFKRFDGACVEEDKCEIHGHNSPGLFERKLPVQKIGEKPLLPSTPPIISPVDTPSTVAPINESSKINHSGRNLGGGSSDDAEGEAEISPPTSTTAPITQEAPITAPTSTSNTSTDSSENGNKTVTHTAATDSPAAVQNSTKGDMQTHREEILDSILQMLLESMQARRNVAPSLENPSLPTSNNDVLSTTPDVVTTNAVTPLSDEINETSTTVMVVENPIDMNTTPLPPTVPFINETASKPIEPQTTPIPIDIQATKSELSPSKKDSSSFSQEKEFFSILNEAFQVVNTALRILTMQPNLPNPNKAIPVEHAPIGVVTPTSAEEQAITGSTEDFTTQKNSNGSNIGSRNLQAPGSNSTATVSKETTAPISKTTAAAESTKISETTQTTRMISSETKIPSTKKTVDDTPITSPLPPPPSTIGDNQNLIERNNPPVVDKATTLSYNDRQIVLDSILNLLLDNLLKKNNITQTSGTGEAAKEAKKETIDSDYLTPTVSETLDDTITQNDGKIGSNNATPFPDKPLAVASTTTSSKANANTERQTTGKLLDTTLNNLLTEQQTEPSQQSSSETTTSPMKETMATEATTAIEHSSSNEEPLKNTTDSSPASANEPSANSTQEPILMTTTAQDSSTGGI